MSKEELIGRIDAELYGNVTSEKDRDQATGKKGYNVMSQNIGTAVFEYLDGTYWNRIVQYVDSRIRPLEEALSSALQEAANATASAKAAQAAALAAQNTSTQTTTTPSTTGSSTTTVSSSGPISVIGAGIIEETPPGAVAASMTTIPFALRTIESVTGINSGTLFDQDTQTASGGDPTVFGLPSDASLEQIKALYNKVANVANLNPTALQSALTSDNQWLKSLAEAQLQNHPELIAH